MPSSQEPYKPSKPKREKTSMAKRKTMWIFFDILVISAWLLGSGIQAGAETMNYKFYNWVIKSESVPISDMEGHAVGLVMRGGFFVFENGEVATANQVATFDHIKGAGPVVWYVSINFVDGSTIVIKNQCTMAGASTASPSLNACTGEITKGTGRFEGIKGTNTQGDKPKVFPLEKGEVYPKSYLEGTITYTLATK
jgi:hypothetical protein